tara:strand:- start:864 stop:1607 length:744 start_codon:yes stop_codon:yes gene_type:complete
MTPETAHEAVVTVARRHNVESSSLIGTVSRHVLASTTTFQTLASLHGGAKDANKILRAYDFVATSGAKLVFSVKFNLPMSGSGEAEPEPRPRTTKRKRDLADGHCLQVQSCVKRVNTGAGSAVPRQEVDVAEAVLTRMVRDVRGPNGEMLVESFGVFVRKLSEQDERPSLVLAVRINAGLAVPVSQLKAALGSCWQDGVVSSESSVMGVQDSDLPLTDEGSASLAQGNSPLLVVTSVPKVAGDGVAS